MTPYLTHAVEGSTDPLQLYHDPVDTRQGYPMLIFRCVTTIVVSHSWDNKIAFAFYHSLLHAYRETLIYRVARENSASVILKAQHLDARYSWVLIHASNSTSSPIITPEG
jgi:hypothetical protein